MVLVIGVKPVATSQSKAVIKPSFQLSVRRASVCRARLVSQCLRQGRDSVERGQRPLSRRCSRWDRIVSRELRTRLKCELGRKVMTSLQAGQR